MSSVELELQLHRREWRDLLEWRDRLVFLLGRGLLKCSTPVFVSSRCDRTNAWETENRAQWGRAPRQRADFALVLSALRVTPWARHAIATINSSGASGNNGYGPTRLAEPSIASTLGTAATLRSTALARNDGSWKKLTDRRGPCLCVVVVRVRTRLMSVYPRGDRSRGQFFVDEEVLNF
jgi:hypothetical protein